ncbi:MAG: outer membrane protein assembly factor [Gammaproteobacteria bacterium]|nr:outer membrane protein assembly factor [Gammaproteobacteria bacterium]
MLTGLPSVGSALGLTVRVEGVSGEQEKNVLAYLEIYQAKGEKDITLQRIELLHARAAQQIEEALLPFGFFRPKILSSLKQSGRGSSAEWSAHYVIDPGPPIRLAAVDYRITGEGAGDKAFAREFPLQPGDLLDQRLYEERKTELLESAAERGYLKPELLASEIVIDRDAYQASIKLHFDTGPKYYLGEIRFEQDELDPEFLASYLNVKPGEPYNVEKILRLQGNLLGTDYFRQVEITPLLDESRDNRVPVDIFTSPNPNNKYRFGVGFATDYGPRVTLDWNIRRVNRRGHKGIAKLLLSPGLQEVSGEYRIPIQNPSSDYISIKPEYIGYDTESRQGDVYQLLFAHSTGLNEWRRTLGVDLKFENYEVADDRDNTRELVPYVSWSRTKTNNPIFTTRGKREKLVLLGSGEGLVSTASYLQLQASGKWIRGLGQDYRILARADLGATLANDVLDLSGSRRFFAGGDVSIRGFGLDETGPTNRSGEVVGGRYLAVGSLELERRVDRKWSVAAFVDGGNALDPDYDNHLAMGAGIGVRWLSPIGQIRLDLASALSEDGNPWRFHIVIGPDL